MKNLHMLFTIDRPVIANMGKLLQTGDAVVLLDEALTLAASRVLNDHKDIDLYSREQALQAKALDTRQSINDEQWLRLCNQAKLIHSWY